MASRWKRFAFFDRKNLSLPPAAVRDVVPSGGLDPTALYPEELQSSSSGDDLERIGPGEYFSLVSASGVSLPGGGGDGDGDGVALERGTLGDAGAAFRTVLTAMDRADRASSVDPSDGRSGGGRGGGGVSRSDHAATVPSPGSGGTGPLQLLFVSSRNTSRVHCVDVTSRCTPSNPRRNEASNSAAGGGAGGDGGEGVGDGGSTVASNAGNPDEMDGWRGHYDPFRSSAGVNQKRDASGGQGRSRTTAASTPATSAGKGRRRAAEQRVLDEHLGPDPDGSGSGGSLFGGSPFAEAPSQSEQRREGARIVGLAACSHVHGPPAAGGGGGGERDGGKESTLYVAAVSDA